MNTAASMGRLAPAIGKLAGMTTLLVLSLLQGCAVPGMPLGSAAGAAPSSTTARPASRLATTLVVPETTLSATGESRELIAQEAVTAGVDAYNRGDYAGAVRRLTAPEVAVGEKAVQLKALKYSAFSYCVTKRQAQCRQQFDKAFRLDPAFDLTPGEKGHPLWGPAFDLAKKASSQKSQKTPAKATP